MSPWPAGNVPGAPRPGNDWPIQPVPADLGPFRRPITLINVMQNGGKSTRSAALQNHRKHQYLRAYFAYALGVSDSDSMLKVPCFVLNLSGDRFANLVGVA